MIAFAHEYGARPILPQPVAKLTSLEMTQTPSAQLAVTEDLAKIQQLVAQLPWGQNVILIEKVKNLRARLWYVQQPITHGWSRNICSSKKGIAALALKRFLEIGCYGTALFMAHRIRHALRDTTFAEKLSGTIEADESAVVTVSKSGWQGSASSTSSRINLDSHESKRKARPNIRP